MDFFIYLPIRQDFFLVFAKGYGEALNNGKFSHTEDFFNLLILCTDFLKSSAKGLRAIASPYNSSRP